MKRKENEMNREEIRPSDKRKNKFIFHVFYREALFLALIYAVFGLLWILLSDQILDLFTDHDTYTRIQTYKGLVYILITAVLVYQLGHSGLKRIHQEFNKTEQAYEELRKVHDALANVETELSFHKDFSNSIVFEAPVIILTWNDKGRILSMNPFGQRQLGYSEEDLQEGLTWNDLVPKERNDHSIAILTKLTNERQFITYEGPVYNKTRELVDILWSSKFLSEGSEGVGITYVSIGTNIEERKQYEDKIRYLAYYDTLTALPNRTLFENEINSYLSRSRTFTIAYIDIDNFKNINDSLGHQVGDIFLQYMASCLKEEIKEPDYIARLGGDEFAIVYDNESLDTIQPRLERIIKRVSKIWTIENNQFYITMSIGVVGYPVHGDSTSSLLKNADIAMYEAKKEGKNRIYIYKEEMEEYNSGHVRMISHLQQAIDQDCFILEYQPQFKLDNGEISGAEALVRWVHPETGLIPPGRFIPLAEQTGQIYSLEKLIFRKALEQKALWEAQGLKNQILSINLSTKTLTSRANFEELLAIIDEYNLDYTRIVIEITETAGISEVDNVIDHLQCLKKRGIKIALDDFGTGYSSLNYLKKFPIDIVKLDRSFISAITEEGVDTLLIKNILTMAHDLSYEVIAEGIETEDQLDYLRRYTCEAGQGYLLSRPLSEGDILRLLKVRA